MADLEQLGRVVWKENLATLEVLDALVAVEEKGVALEEGYSSCYAYRTQKLKCSEEAANRRIRAERVLAATGGGAASAEREAYCDTATSGISRYIPAEVKRQVFARDGGRCCKCDSDWMVEVDHIQPLALGGTTELSNLRLLCSNHNQHEARKMNLM